MTDASWDHSSNVDLFEKLSHKLASLVYTKTEGDKKLLLEILQELNALDFNVVCLKSNEKGVLVINQCCYLITPEEENLILMACDLFINLITKQQVSIESKTLSLAVSWCLQALKYKSYLSVLKCLQILIKGRKNKIEHQLIPLINELKRITNNFEIKISKVTDVELLLHCLKCIETIVSPFESPQNGGFSSEIINDCFEIFIKILYFEKFEKGAHQIKYSKCLISAMRGIGNLLESSDYILDIYISDILGIVKGYMLYGLPGGDGYQIKKVLPCQIAVPDVFKNNSGSKKLKGKYDRKVKKIPVTSITSVEEGSNMMNENDLDEFCSGNSQIDNLNFNSFKTSDSDYSEDELSQNSKVRLQESKVRQCALILLGLTVKKIDPKLFAGYLPNFLPDGSQIPHVRTLITCLLKDSSPWCRAEVVGILSMLISNSKQYFLQGDNTFRTSFTTFSSTIGNITRELHRSLALALVAENSVTVINRLLKCISELIRCSPYRKLEFGMLTRLSRYVKSFINHKDVNVQISALSVFGRIASVESHIKEVRDVIMKELQTFDNNKNDSHDDAEEGEKSIAEEHDFDADHVYEEPFDRKSWLFELCLKNIIGDRCCAGSTNTALVIESLEVIGALVRNFFQETVVRHPCDIIDVLQICSGKPEYLIRLYGGKLMETVFNSLQFSLTLKDASLRAPISLVTQLWEVLLPGPVTSLIQSENEPMLRCTGCDCLANVGVLIHDGQQNSIQNSFIFDLLIRKHQILCVTLLFGCILDESAQVRSSAIRALGVLVLFQSLLEDFLFFFDATDAAVESAQDENNNVRYQSAWLVGNLSESVVQHYDKLDHEVMNKILLKILQTGIRLSQDSPKIRPGALRAIGNVMRVINDDYLMKYKDSVVEGLSALIKNANTGSFMKARWNSCYAIANSLKNEIIFRNRDLIAKIFSSMINLVQNYKNFKVRISAAFALWAPPNRENYGDYYIRVWSAILNAFENSKNVYDVNEYQHRDQLVDQLCFVVLHLFSMIEIDDLIYVQDIMVQHLDNVRHCMGKFQERIIPEKGDIILKATARIHSLLDGNNLKIEHKSAINLFENLLRGTS